MENEIKIEIKRSWIIFYKNEIQVARLFFHRIYEVPEDCVISELNVPCINILRLYVHPNYRNIGYGHKIMKLLFENNKRIKDFVVLANPDEESIENRIRLLNFYKSFGFKPIGERDDGTLMYCKIKN